jgi:hypothetical protein
MMFVANRRIRTHVQSEGSLVQRIRSVVNVAMPSEIRKGCYFGLRDILNLTAICSQDL